jgi:GT2 family glycosyltransferase
MQAAHALDPEALIGGRTMNALTDNRWATTSQVIVEMARLFYTDEELGPRFFASNNLALPAAGYRELGGFCETFRKAAEDREFCDRWCQAGYHMRYEPAALVGHAHDLSAVSFWRQHYRYGFGAWEFHRLRRRRGSGQLRDDVVFHFKLGSLLRRATPGAGSRARRRLVPLLLVWQVANTLGFVGGLLSAIGPGRDERGEP